MFRTAGLHRPWGAFHREHNSEFIRYCCTSICISKIFSLPQAHMLPFDKINLLWPFCYYYNDVDQPGKVFSSETQFWCLCVRDVAVCASSKWNTRAGHDLGRRCNIFLSFDFLGIQSFVSWFVALIFLQHKCILIN